MLGNAAGRLRRALVPGRPAPYSAGMMTEVCVRPTLPAQGGENATDVVRICSVNCTFGMLMLAKLPPG
jgi:hypothetical protein